MLIQAPWMGTREYVAPVVASSPLVTMRKASVRSKPTHCGRRSQERIAEECRWNSNRTMPEIPLGSALRVKGMNSFLIV